MALNRASSKRSDEKEPGVPQLSGSVVMWLKDKFSVWSLGNAPSSPHESGKLLMLPLESCSRAEWNPNCTHMLEEAEAVEFQ